MDQHPRQFNKWLLEKLLESEQQRQHQRPIAIAI
jgi:hypothetical protein